jgi:hypothetical protein
MIKRTFYGWFDHRGQVFRLSLVPPDGPVRPSLALETKEDVDEYARRKRGRVLWYPPLGSVQALDRAS